MNRSPFAYRDYARARASLKTAIAEEREAWSLLIGGTGTGKSALHWDLRQSFERSKLRVIYYCDAKRLGAPGLVKMVGEALRARSSNCHAVAFSHIQRALQDDPQRILLWLDEAQDLPEGTIAQVRAMVEGESERAGSMQVLLSGLPELRERLQDQPPIWRRIMVRETLTGLAEDEALPFLEHHFGEQGGRLCDLGRHELFEGSKGSPGVMVAMYRQVLLRAEPAGRIDAAAVAETLSRWELS